MPTSLEGELIELIKRDGPITLARYMAECLGNERHGYYMTRDPLGAKGDFTTAPEVSQMFGEIVGLWLIHSWHILGEPPAFNLVELGPGRGTLMSDILRVGKAMPSFLDAANIYFVEMSPKLRAVQEEKHGDAIWVDHLGDVPKGPTLIVANEFFDALPVHQFEKTPSGMMERAIGLDKGTLAHTHIKPTFDFEDSGKPGDVFEVAPLTDTIIEDIMLRLKTQIGAALIIDYGYRKTQAGDSLQALLKHQFTPLLAMPGEADITAHVNFGAIKDKAIETGTEYFGPITQGEFLTTLGIKERAGQLRERGTSEQQDDIDAALKRLIGEKEMGELFKVMAISSNTKVPLTGFNPQ